ncbi:MAG TPA: beta-propeller fold lactonase family protein [Steroidobacteraceae bacterium]|nr:beta-propeller fold lactonase family protein [Steroidobacteraceae bacterium]
MITIDTLGFPVEAAVQRMRAARVVRRRILWEVIGERLRLGTVLLGAVSLTACGGGGKGSGGTPPTSYHVGGAVTGLSGSGLALTNNGGEKLAISANGAFAFATALSGGASYSVAVASQPTNPAQTCTVTNGSGAVSASDITNITVACATGGGDIPPTSYHVGGTVTGLSGSGLALTNSGGDRLTISADGTFSFATALSGGASYAVAVASQPTNPVQTCTVTNGSGAVSASDITNITVACVTGGGGTPPTSYHLGGTVTGLSGSGLAVTDNGGDKLTISANGTFVFATALSAGASYAVAVASQPTNPAQTCTVTNGTGAVNESDIANIAIACTTDPTIFPRFVYVPTPNDHTVSIYAVDPTTSALRARGYVVAGSTPNSVSLTPNGKFAYVPNLDSSNVSAYTVDAASGNLVPVAGSPFATGLVPFAASVHPSGRFVYTVNQGSATGDPGTLSVFGIDAASGALSTVPGSPYSANGRQPTAIVFDPTGRFAYVPNLLDNTVAAFSINQSTGAPTPIGGPVVTGQYPTAASVDPSAKVLYIVNAGSSSISGYTINAATGVISSISGSPWPTGGTGPQAINIDPAGRFAYVTNGDSKNISIFAINATTGGLSLQGSLLAVTGTPYAMSMDPSGKLLRVGSVAPDMILTYAVDGQSGTLSLLSSVRARGPSSGVAIAMSLGPTRVAFKPRFAYMTSSTSNTVSAYTIDATTGALTANASGPVASGNGPASVTVDLQGRFAFVANTNSSNLSVFSIDAGTGSLTPVTGSPFPGVFPTSVAIEPGGRFAYVSNSLAPSLSVYSIDAAGRLTAVGAQVPVGTSPTAVSIDPSGKFAYVANATGQLYGFRIHAFTGELLPIPGSPLLVGGTPRTIAFDPTGRVAYMANTTSNDISTFNIDGSTGALTGFGLSTDAGNPISITVDPTGRFVHAANYSASSFRAYAIDQASGALRPFSPNFVLAGQPVSVNVDPSGRFLYLPVDNTGKVYAFSFDAVSGQVTSVPGMPFSGPAGSAPGFTVWGTTQ